MSGNTSTNTTNTWDWSWKTTPAMGAALVAGGAYSVAAMGAATGLPPVHAGAVAAVGALAQATVDLRRDRPAGHILARAAAWLAAGGWTATTIAHGTPFAWTPFGAWAAGATAGLVLATGLARGEQTARAGRAAALLQRWADGQAAEWHQRLTALFRLEGHSVSGVKPWPEDVGYTVRVELPPGVESLPGNAARVIAGALRLPRGGGVEILDGEEHGTVMIRVTLVDVLATTIAFPDGELSVTTINNPIEIGRHPDGTPVLLPMVDTCTVMIGQTDSGKTNAANVVNGKVLQANDVLVWHIDTTGAGLSLPWLRAWALDGTAKRPVLDWVAPTEEEAHIMLDVAIEGMAARKTGYQDLMLSVDDDKIPVSPDVPEILIVADEIAQLPQSILEKLNAVINVGRATRFREMSIGLRATADVSTPAMKKQSQNRIGMRVSDPEELGHLFPYGQGRLDPRAARHQGSGHVSYPGADGITMPARPFKAERLKPSRIGSLSVQFADRRPTMDALTVDTPSGRYYASRWGRTLPVLFKGKALAATTRPWTDVPLMRPPISDRGIPMTGANPTKPTAAPGSTTPGKATVQTGPVDGAGMSELLEQARQRLRNPERATAHPGGDDAFAAVLAQTGPTQWGDRPAQARENTTGDAVPELLTRAHRAVEDAGGRMHTADLADALGMDAQSLGNELGALMRAVGVSRRGTGMFRIDGGTPRPGFHAETLAEAIRNYRT
ncbi:hypothetical protein ACFZBU_34245 [Embleya sp. NPDC008237]|uniref:hypothetical protein n=1 Tax=Embleya sp. NPDC008237 TaxID=3363978 RepID=UPI0036EEB7E2